MTARNDITGDVIATKVASDAYRDNFDAIFRKKPEPVKVVEVQEPEVDPARVLRDQQTRRWWAYREAHQRDDSLPTFAEFRDNILPTLGDNQYAKFLKG